MGQKGEPGQIGAQVSYELYTATYTNNNDFVGFSWFSWKSR